MSSNNKEQKKTLVLKVIPAKKHDDTSTKENMSSDNTTETEMAKIHHSNITTFEVLPGIIRPSLGMVEVTSNNSIHYVRDENIDDDITNHNRSTNQEEKFPHETNQTEHTMITNDISTTEAMAADSYHRPGAHFVPGYATTDDNPPLSSDLPLTDDAVTIQISESPSDNPPPSSPHPPNITTAYVVNDNDNESERIRLRKECERLRHELEIAAHDDDHGDINNDRPTQSSVPPVVPVVATATVIGPISASSPGEKRIAGRRPRHWVLLITVMVLVITGAVLMSVYVNIASTMTTDENDDDGDDDESPVPPSPNDPPLVPDVPQSPIKTPLPTMTTSPTLKPIINIPNDESSNDLSSNNPEEPSSWEWSLFGTTDAIMARDYSDDFAMEVSLSSCITPSCRHLIVSGGKYALVYHISETGVIQQISCDLPMNPYCYKTTTVDGDLDSRPRSSNLSSWEGRNVHAVISGDGERVALGTDQYEGSNEVLIFEDGHVWTQCGDAIVGEGGGGDGNEDGPPTFFGYAIDLSYNGSIVAIGAPEYSTGGYGSPTPGRTRIYKYENGHDDDTTTDPSSNYQWYQLGGDIIGDDSEGTGASLSLSHDGTVVAIGAHEWNAHARIFRFDSNGKWSLMGNQTLINDRGNPLSLSGDGTTIAFLHSVFRYNETDHVWKQVGNDFEEVDDYPHGDVAISGDGRRVAISTDNGESVDLDNKRTGYVRVFDNVFFGDNDEESGGGYWSQVGQTIVGDSYTEYFGASISLSDDGMLLAVGAPGSVEFMLPKKGLVRLYRLKKKN